MNDNVIYIFTEKDPPKVYKVLQLFPADEVHEKANTMIVKDPFTKEQRYFLLPPYFKNWVLILEHSTPFYSEFDFSQRWYEKKPVLHVKDLMTQKQVDAVKDKLPEIFFKQIAIIPNVGKLYQGYYRDKYEKYLAKEKQWRRMEKEREARQKAQQNSDSDE